ncbi:non-homologous end joining protein Ku [Cellvibrio zantedeschiae]|uniref:Non-homologous end joining protein Ku n=1 Tax=Cellvibrio zantedeschiae TaxID=1237077 RepID=A0ABQ3B349_9GAMM|nr:Ku protein [Cellvibrio zantedeschiae]GGY71816.1 non-homologous end joining protein Ku [Cellvibrio zantedeschiae]
MARVIWKGAISFGLVHIPVALQSATESQSIDFDWLDERSMEPVGYKRINKVTGKEIAPEHVVKGIEYEKGRYVILSEEEIKTAHPASTQTIDIFSFIDSDQIPLTNIDTPYYLAPDKRGEKVYALLRETLTDTNKVALAYVILHTRQHLAALMPIDSALVLILLRWPTEVRSLDSIALTKTTTEASLTKSEKEMAKRLVSDMAGKWEPEEYRDSFHEKIMELVETKARNGEIENVETDIGETERKSADIIDLTELLKRSLRGKAETKSSKSEESKSVSASKPKAKPEAKAKKKTGASSGKSTQGKSPSAKTVRAKSAR